jgi:hypothetical protein
MNAVPGASPCSDRLPVRDATAVSAANRAQCAIPLNVGLSRIRSGFDRHRAPLKIHPWAADPAAQRTVAGSGGLRRGRQSKADGATVTRPLMHCQNSPLFPKCSQLTRDRTFPADNRKLKALQQQMAQSRLAGHRRSPLFVGNRNLPDILRELRIRRCPPRYPRYLNASCQMGPAGAGSDDSELWRGIRHVLREPRASFVHVEPRQLTFPCRGCSLENGIAFSPSYVRRRLGVPDGPVRPTRALSDTPCLECGR